MFRYALRRIAASLPVLLLVTLISFSMMHLVPGDPAAAIAGAGATNREIEAIRAQLGLDRPFLEQMLAWYGGLFRGDLGRSILLNRPVWQAIVERLPITLPLALFGLVLTVLIGVPAGVIAALRANSWVDQAVTALAMLGVSVPSFWLALMLIVLFGVHLEWLPTGGFVPFGQDPAAWARSMVLPSVSLALLQIGLLARITRGTMLEVLRQDFVRTARAKGLPGWMVIGKHALKNVMVPVVTVIGISFGLLLSGSIVIETVYGMPGIGRLMANAIFGRDYPVIQGGLLITGVMLVLLNLVVDILYAVIDPRVRYGGG
ncbi:MAG: ABC transporter permease [Acetobacteraceae bacterium]|nr:ABC transporter permease [Acetobacteraceae bacterium]